MVRAAPESAPKPGVRDGAWRLYVLDIFLRKESLFSLHFSICLRLLLFVFSGRVSLQWGALVVCWGCCNKQPEQQQWATCWFLPRPVGELVLGLFPSSLLSCHWLVPSTCTSPSLCPSCLCVQIPPKLMRTPVLLEQGPLSSVFYTQSSAKTLFPSKVTFTGPGSEDFHSSLRGHDSSQNGAVAWHCSFKYQLL